MSDDNKAFWKTPAGKAAVALIALITGPAILMLASTVMVSSMVSSIGGVAGDAASGDGSGGSCSASGGGDFVHVDASSMRNNQDAADLLNMLHTGANGIDLKGLKLTDVAIAAAFGNWQQESGVHFQIWEGGDTSPHTNEESLAFTAGNKGLGLAQWTGATGSTAGDRGEQLIRFAESRHQLWSDGRVQTQMFINEITGPHYKHVLEAINATDDIAEATTIFQRDFEGGGTVSGSIGLRIQYAKEWLPIIKENHGGTTTVSTSSSGGCGANGDVEYGGLGDAPTNTHDFGWMCDTPLKICKNGDFGVPPLDWSNFNTPGGYQCYWYWLARSYLVHGSAFNPHTAMGGDITSVGVAAYPDKIKKLDNPKPGAGVCFLGAHNNHVAFVEKVEPDPSGWKILISEGNFGDGNQGSWNSYNTRWLTKTQYEAAEGAGFIWETQWDK